MSRRTAGRLLTEFRALGVVFRLTGGRLHVSAPARVVSPESKDRLQVHRVDVATLLVEEAIAGGSVSGLFRDNLVLQGLPPSARYVSTDLEAESLLQAGVVRGEIYTAEELAHVLLAPGISANDAAAIARMKEHFGAEIVSSEGYTPQAELDPAPRPCFTGKGAKFWESAYGAITCVECHPPAAADLVVKLIEATQLCSRGRTEDRSRLGNLTRDANNTSDSRARTISSEFREALPSNAESTASIANSEQ